VTCSGEEGHPQYWNGTPEDPVFLNGEKLFRRYRKEDFYDQRLLPAAFKFPRQSFNRERYSTPEDVLHSDCCNGQQLVGWGVLECSATDLPTPIDGPNNRRFHFAAVHQPRECCYAHTELWCRIEDQWVDEPSPKKLKETFRVLLAQRMTIRIVAQI
jgi:hypothetical protein